jgi:tetratricopeptide (TPR) repeat protein
MAIGKYKCTNKLECILADEDSVVDEDSVIKSPDGKKLCPGCTKETLELIMNKRFPWKLIAIAAGVIVLVGLAWFFWPGASESGKGGEDTAKDLIEKFFFEQDISAVVALGQQGLVRVEDSGLLAAAGTLDEQQAKVVTAENPKWRELLDSVAQKSELPPEQVAALFVPRAREIIGYVDNGSGNASAPCQLTPAQNVDVARLLQYMKQGMMYAKLKDYEAALSEFQQGLIIDPNFIGLHSNAGASLLALKRYKDAETQFNDEVKLVDCLEPLPDNTLQKYAYMFEGDGENGKVAALRVQLKNTKMIAQYNLACLYSRQEQKEQALIALRNALKTGFTDKKSLESDPDLSFIRNSPEFKEIMKLEELQ